MKEFIKNIFLKSTDESSKRVFGAIGFICAIFFIALFDHKLIAELMYTSAALLGLGILDRKK